MTYYTHRQTEEPPLNPPDESVLYPRDNEQPSGTSDYLFLAALLMNWNDTADLLIVYGKPEPVCVLKSPENIFRHPVTGFIMDDSGRSPLFQLKRKTAAGYFRKKYFMMRRILASPNLHMYENTVRIDDRLIVKEVVEETRPERLRYSISHKNTFEICKENLAALNVALQYKLEDEAFKNTFRTVIRPDLLNLKANSGRAVCPFDGVVEPVTVIISSPLWTWRGLCGREYTGLLCPECLGIVSPFTLARMS